MLQHKPFKENFSNQY